MNTVFDKDRLGRQKIWCFTARLPAGGIAKIPEIGEAKKALFAMPDLRFLFFK